MPPTMTSNEESTSSRPQPLDDDSASMSEEEEEEDYEEEEEEEEEYSNPPKQIQVLWNFICCEARSVSVWCVLAPFVRLFLALLTRCATPPSTTKIKIKPGMGSVLASWILGIFPSKVSQNLAPGFAFGWSVLLFGVSDTFYGPLPNLPVRICETIMGRITFQELLICFPVHVSCTLSTIKAFAYLGDVLWTPDLAIDPILYSSHNPWLSDFIREVMVTTFFVIGLLVVPELLKLNHIPRWMTMFFLYPLYNLAVDADGQSSTFAPNVLYSLVTVARDRQDELGGADTGVATTSTVTFPFTHMMGPLLGGFVAGKIMNKYFPDHS